MSLETVAAAIAIFIGVGGALIQIIKVIVQHSTDTEFDAINERVDKELNRSSERIFRLERRQAMLEMKMSGDSDTFSNS